MNAASRFPLDIGQSVRDRTGRRGVITDRRKRARRYTYHVRWRGNDHDSGEYGQRDLLLPRGTAY